MTYPAAAHCIGSKQLLSHVSRFALTQIAGLLFLTIGKLPVLAALSVVSPKRSVHIHVCVFLCFCPCSGFVLDFTMDILATVTGLCITCMCEEKRLYVTFLACPDYKNVR